MQRRNSRRVMVGGVAIGGGAPVVVQSMTNTDTADAAATAQQVFDLWRADSELVRHLGQLVEIHQRSPSVEARQCRKLAPVASPLD